MKHSAFWLLTFLLTTTSVTWAMEPLEEEGASRWNQPQLIDKEDSSFTTHLQSKPPEGPATATGDPLDPRWEQETTTSQISITCQGNPFDPRPAPTPVHVLKATSQLGGMIDLKLSSPSLLMEESDKKILEHLKNFGLSSQKADHLWEEFKRIKDLKGSTFPFVLASHDPFYIASGLWRAHQERLCQLQFSQTAWPFKMRLSSLLTESFSNIYKRKDKDKRKDTVIFKKMSVAESALLKSLISSNPYFKRLELFNASVRDAHLSQIGLIPHLEELSLENSSEEKDAGGNNIFTDASLKLLIKYPNLQKLNLSKNKILPQGAKILAQSQTLKHLNLYKCAINDEGAEYFSRNTVLDYLDLRENGIGDKGAIALGSNNKTLTDLRLRYNKITNNGAEAFLKSHHLTHLELGKNQISADRVFFLEHLMPSNGYLNKIKDPKELPPSLLPPQKDRVRILSIDGGGIRGLLPGAILQYIEESLTQKIGHQFYFAKHLDLIAGTSTGGIISLGMVMPGERGYPKYTLQTLVDLYKTKGPQIFPAPWCGLPGVFHATYSPIALETFLNEYFGETYLSECLCPTLITSFDLRGNKALTFESYTAKKKESKNFQLRGAGRATSAAPTYFPSALIKNKLGEEYVCVDGGIYANNPTLLAIESAQKLYPSAKEYKVYSFGTGQESKISLSYLKEKGILEWGLNIADVLMNNAAEYTEKLINSAIKKDSRIKYVRIQPHIQASESKMDNVNADNIINLLDTAKVTIQEKKKDLDMIIADFYRDFHTQAKK